MPDGLPRAGAGALITARALWISSLREYLLPL
jgi:hypothetical protein